MSPRMLASIRLQQALGRKRSNRGRDAQCDQPRSTRPIVNVQPVADSIKRQQ